MRLLTITIFAMSVLAAGCTTTAGDPASSGDPIYTSETIFGYEDNVLPLPVSTAPGDQLFAYATWGIQVVEILVDGQPAFRRPSYRDLDDTKSDAITVQGSTYTYKISLDSMFFGRFSPDDLDYSLTEYLIPEDAKVLEIAYRLVPHDNVPDERIYTVKASRIR